MTDQELDAMLATLAPVLPETDETRALHERPTALRDAVLAYASAGWPVFPLRVGMKTPATQRGFYDASTDPEQITAWWTATPWANIGTPTGLRFDVVDIDAPAGYASFATMRDSLRATGSTWPTVLGVAYTGNHGRHVLVPATGNGNTTATMPGLDYRGRGGYVVLAPSRLAPDGRRYAWLTPPAASILGGAE